MSTPSSGQQRLCSQQEKLMGPSIPSAAHVHGREPLAARLVLVPLLRGFRPSDGNLSVQSCSGGLCHASRERTVVSPASEFSDAHISPHLPLKQAFAKKLKRCYAVTRDGFSRVANLREKSQMKSRIANALRLSHRGGQRARQTYSG